MRRRTPVLVLAALAIAGTACGTAAASASSDHPRPAAQEVHLDLSTNGKTVHAHDGEYVVVALPAFADGGYEWALTSSKGLTLDSRRYVPPTSKAPGATGFDVFVFTASKRGTDHLSLADRRPWTGGGIGQRFSATVVVS